jgi:hypothetical protein
MTQPFLREDTETSDLLLQVTDLSIHTIDYHASKHILLSNFFLLTLNKSKTVCLSLFLKTCPPADFKKLVLDIYSKGTR